eukprot:CAMPEP_0197826250 /NCGR_PEP_ID=MMETSP1437-20131217/3226_1 /TAXON_ID=49252 ORGANISM="Eucampia antarctica, Strain CCMP1452" /NCGR_SAMPLE_ID=MMETSP1437 /ASSEMBLY_ACC=CAM_ASM_001096 /LENGTH=201 /DNA_ID=CAMNT_0043426603 /DNA_START=341 /DNA_END=946 /DNA_ORIENTATION=-
MSKSIPFLARPKALTGELAGDVGFDPLGLAPNKECLFEYREAEIKHSRLAMLAAAGWPASELYDKKIAAIFGYQPAVDAFDRAPSILNGGLDTISPIWWGFCLGMTAAIDTYGIQRGRSAQGNEYIPGDLGWDPLGLYPVDEPGKKQMQLAEIKHGRLAMLAILGYTIEEAIVKEGVVLETPFFFEPITESMKPFFYNILN